MAGSNDAASQPATIRLTVVGDGNVGKTAALVTYTTHQFPDKYQPTVFETYSGSITVDGATYTMDLWDTSTFQLSVLFD